MISFSFSSSSSGNFQNNSKKSEKINSKKSILRKEGSTSKNKDKHAVFIESNNQVEFYVPDINNQNKNHRISLNTVSEEPENSRSGSDLINNLSSNRASINSQGKISFIDNNMNNNNYSNNKIDNNNAYNNLNQQNSNVNISEHVNNLQNNYINNNQYNYPNNINNNFQYNNQKNNSNKNNLEINFNNNIKSKIFKKPKSRLTLDSAYFVQDIQQNNSNIQNELNEKNIKKPEINNRNSLSKYVEVKLSIAESSSVPQQNNMNNINQESQLINASDTSNNSTNQKIEEQTKINTEVNKNLFNINKQNNNLNINSSLIHQSNDKPDNTNIINNNINNINSKLNNNINLINENNIISKNFKKPNVNKRITLVDKDLLPYGNKIFNNSINNSNLNNNINYDKDNNAKVNLPTNFNNNINNFNNNAPNNIIRNSNINNNNEILNSNLNNNNLNSNINSNINDNKIINDKQNNIISNNKLLNNEIRKDFKKPRKNLNRITMSIKEINAKEDNNYENLKNEPIQNDYNINKSNYININEANNINLNNKDYNDKKVVRIPIYEEPKYEEPKIIAEERNINYENYEKYLKFNNIIYPLSEKKFDIHINLNNKDNFNNNINIASQTVRKNKLNDSILRNLESFNNYDKSILNQFSSPLIELIQDQSNQNIQNEINFPKREKYSFSINNNENFDIEKEIHNQINFINNNLEEKANIWKEKNKKNAADHLEFEAEKSKNENELNYILNKSNEANNQLNDIIMKNKYDKLSEKAQKINFSFIEKGIDIKDIEYISYKEMNCLSYTVLIKNNLIYKFLISDNICYEKNLTGDIEVIFIGVTYTEVFSNYFSDIAVINKDENTNLLIQKYFNETIKKVFPNEYQSISIHKLSHIYYLSTQISLCFIHIIKMIVYIASIDEEFSFNSQDLKKYIVKFSHITIYNAKINFEFILNIENPFSGNYLNSVEVEKFDYILNDFDEYRKKKINTIWKYFNPKDIQINYKYFYNIFLMLGYIDKIDIYKENIDDEYIFNVMQGNIMPKEDEDYFGDKENFNFDSQELLKQIETIYGKDFLISKKENQNKLNDNNNENNKINNINEENNIINNSGDNNDNDEIILHLPSSKEDDENEKDLNAIIEDN